MSELTDYDFIVIGGGASGVFAAIRAAELRPELRILILEKSSRLLDKVRISGGGRCNVTNGITSKAEFAQQYPRGAAHVRKLLHIFSQTDTVTWFESRGVPLVTETDNRVFPKSNSSESIIQCLKEQIDRYRIEVRYNQAVLSIKPLKKGFECYLHSGKLSSRFLLVACGGIPKIESYAWLAELHLKIETPVPSLFTFNIPEHPAKNLMGLSAYCRIKIDGSNIEETGPLLITHWGFSGPAVLRCSARGARFLADCNYRFRVKVSWLPEFHQDQVRDILYSIRSDQAKRLVQNTQAENIPKRLWEYLLSRIGIIEDIRWAETTKQQLNKLAEVLVADFYEVAGKTTFKDEFVTCGGVSLQEIDSNTCMSKKHDGLFFAGEILDVDGITGGFNFQHAWSSGYTAGSHIATIF